MENLNVKKQRIEVVDALRGFAVMAIILVHNLEHFIFPVYPAGVPDWLSALDSVVVTVVFSLFAGKAYAIFALLFGFTFHLQTDNQRRRGGDFGYRFLWRMILLLVFATLNAAFFPAGDVLLLFVVVSLVLFFTRNWSGRAILVAALVFLFQPVEWYHFIAALLNPAHTLPDLQVGQMYAEVAECVKTGGFWDFILCNVTLGQKASLLWAVDAGRISQTAGLFLMGFYIGRRRLFVASEQSLRFWTRALIAAAIAFAPLYALRNATIISGDTVQRTVGTILDMWQKLAFTCVLVSSFVLLYQSGRFVRLVGNLRFYGRMSLTNYITQSVLGAAIYFPFGLYLAPYCGYTVSLLIGVFTFALQVWFSKWWLARHGQGPLEHIWHKWTWLGNK